MVKFKKGHLLLLNGGENDCRIKTLHMLNARGRKKFNIPRSTTTTHYINWKKKSSLLLRLHIFHFQGLLRYESINNTDTKIWRFKLKRQIVPRPPGPKQWILMHLFQERDKSALLILCHIYQLITYLLFQFFPSLQPSCLRTLHLWQGDKKVSIQGW